MRFCCPGGSATFNSGTEPPSAHLEDQSRKPAVLSGMILVSSCSTLTSISSPSNPLIATSSAFDCSIHGVFMILVLSSGEPQCGHDEDRRPGPRKFAELSPFFSVGVISVPRGGC